MHPDVMVSSIDLGTKLGSGGQGEVFRVRNRPGDVFKRYVSPTIDAAALTALVGFPDSLSDREREALGRQTAWPFARVTDGRRAVGFLMREVPTTFVGRTGAGPKLRELQYLLYRPKPMWGDITPLDTTGRVEVAQQFVRLARILQDHSIIMGDVSMRNVLWSHGFPARIFLIDCDGFAACGGRPVLPQPETPDWTDPEMPAAGADLDTDRYKVALLVGRVIAGDAEVRPGQQLNLPADLPEAVGRQVTEFFKAAAGPHGSRPDLTQWALALSGRGTVSLPAPPPLRRLAPSLPMVNIDGRGKGNRASIRLPPPAAGQS